MTISSTVPTHRAPAAWFTMLGGKTTAEMANRLLVDLVGYNQRSVRRGRDTANLAAALDAIVKLHDAGLIRKNGS